MRKLFILCTLLAGNALAVTSGDLAEVFRVSVPHHAQVPVDVAQAYLDGALKRLVAKGVDLRREQFFLAVDTNTSVQTLFVFLGSPSAGYHLLGASPVSTGARDLDRNYVTAEGVYDHTLEGYPDFRAEGAVNEKGIKESDAKKMRVWDFGGSAVQKSVGKNREEKGNFRFQMHTSDPTFLEKRIGEVASKGGVRIGGALNIFLDKYGALDWNYEQARGPGKRPKIWRKDHIETPYSGRYLVVLDSGAKVAPAWKLAGMVTPVLPERLEAPPRAAAPRAAAPKVAAPKVAAPKVAAPRVPPLTAATPKALPLSPRAEARAPHDSEVGVIKGALF